MTGTNGVESIDIEALEARYAAERDKRLRADGSDQYAELAGSFADYDADPWADPDFARDAIAEDTDVLIIGAGLGGLLAACRLREAGVEKLRIVEKGADFGGTWYWNRYPGAACDVESYIYMPMLEELGYVPTEKYAKAPEIYGHCRRVAEHYRLYPAALFQTVVTGACWDDATHRWVVTTDRGDAIAARFVVSATGLLSKAKLARIPGIESFAGPSFHTSRWDYGVTGGDQYGGMTKLADKRVGIIGTGATAIQCVPYLAQDAGELFVFQRTPSSVDVRGNQPTDPEWARSLKPGWQRERMENFGMISSGAFQPLDLVDDGWTEIFRTLAGHSRTEAAAGYDPVALQRAEMAKMENTRRRVDEIVRDPATAEALKPYFHYFCKRPGFHDEYLDSFNRPNVTLVDTAGKGVERITPRGVVANGREYELDLLIFGTGFEYLSEYVRETGIDPVGPGGRKLSEHWNEGARTYRAMQTHGFPNYLLLSVVQGGGPVNYVHVIDEMAQHAAYIVRRCLADGIDRIQPTAEAEEAWVQEVLTLAAARRPFFESCTPGYSNFEGKRRKSQELNDFYYGAPMAFLNMLRDWRAEGQLRDMQIG
jgi:cation diffusion facilitator CzcD-associated flavoprotein CzcO